MAQVPYQDGVPTTSPGSAPPNDYSSVRATPDEFGANIDQGITQVGAGMSKAGQYFGQVQTDDAINTALTQSNKVLADFKALNGGDALRARPGTEDAINTAIKNGREGLDTPEQQHAYDQATRSYQQRYFSGQITSHADQQAKVYAAKTNSDSMVVALNGVANVADDDQAIEPFLHDARSAAVRQVQTEGNGDDPAQVNSAIQRADQAVYKTQAQAIAVKDPARALALVEKHKDILGADYPQLANSFRNRADEQVGNDAGQKAIEQTYARPVAASNGALVAQLTPIGQQYGISGNYLARTHQLEDANNSQTVNSAGAAGPFQFIPSTAAKYGLTDRFDFHQSADAAARLAADNRTSLQSSLGRAPTDAELYLAHQQGAGGAAKLLANPNVRAGALVGDAAIRQNGGDPNAPASAFTSMWTQKFNGSTGVMSARAKQSAYQTIMDNPDLTPQQRQHALTYVNRQMAAHEVADNENAKARKAASDQAANQIVTAMGTGKPPTTDDIWNNPALEWQTKEHLVDRLAKSGTDEGDAANYGPAYTQTLKQVVAQPGDPSKISDAAQIIAMGANKQLSDNGVKKLLSYLKDMQGSETAGTAQGRSSLLNYAKSKLSFEQDTGPVKIRDPKGEAVFNGQFVPKFEAAYDQWVKAGKNPWDFLTRENVDKMAAGMRSQSQMAQDRLVATGQAVPGEEAPNAPLPPAPDGFDPKGWGAVIQNPPTLVGGGRASHQQWAQVLEILGKNPAPNVMAAFDKRFAPAGLTAAEVLKQIRPAPANAAVPQAAPAAAVASPAVANPPQVAQVAAPMPAAIRPAQSVDDAIAARKELVAQRHAYIREGLTAISEGRAPRFKIAAENVAPEAPLSAEQRGDITKAGGAEGIAGMKAMRERFQHMGNLDLKEAEQKHQQQADAETKRYLEAELSRLAGQKNPHAVGSPAFTIQNERIAKQRAFLQSQLETIGKPTAQARE